MADVWAYIDETGDRGMSAASSPIFGMAAVIVDRQGAADLRSAVDRLRNDFKVPTNKVMSWKEHLKSHDRRRHAAQVLSEVGNLKVCYVYASKAALAHAPYTQDRALFYNYVARKTYTSILWAVRSWKGDRARLWTRFGHVRHHDHQPTKAYLLREARRDTRIPDHMEQGLRWVTASQYAESQAADLFGGFLKAALWPSGEFEMTEPAYLLKVWAKIRNSESCAIPLGIMSMPDSSLVTREPWFPCATCGRA